MRTDAQLLEDACTDASAFREIYDRYARRIHGYHRRRTGDDDAAHDLTAETFARAWLRRAHFRDEADGSAAPWLFTIAHHVLAASVRQRRLERAARERLGLMGRLDAGTPAEPEEQWLDDVDDVLEELPEGQRDAIRLRIVDDLGYEDVAEALGTTAQAARVRVHRGLSTLRARITDDDRSRP